MDLYILTNKFIFVNTFFEKMMNLEGCIFIRFFSIKHDGVAFTFPLWAKISFFVLTFFDLGDIIICRKGFTVQFLKGN